MKFHLIMIAIVMANQVIVAATKGEWLLAAAYLWLFSSTLYYWRKARNNGWD